MLNLWNWIILCRKGGLQNHSLSPWHSECHTSPGSSFTFLATPQFYFQAHLSLIGWVRGGHLAFLLSLYTFFPRNIIQDHSFHYHVSNEYSQLFIPSSQNSIPFHSIQRVCSISTLDLAKTLKFNTKDKNSWSNSNLLQFQHNLPQWKKAPQHANCARWKTRTRFKDFFFLSLPALYSFHNEILLSHFSKYPPNPSTHSIFTATLHPDAISSYLA